MQDAVLLVPSEHVKLHCADATFPPFVSIIRLAFGTHGVCSC